MVVLTSKMEGSDERAGWADDIERYEQLRCYALGGGAQGQRSGLALLERRGLFAWSRAWQTTAPRASKRPVAQPPAAGEEIVGVLAAMAFACLTSG